MQEENKRPIRMTVKQAAKEFFEGNVSEGLIYKMVNSGEIPHVRLTDGKILLDAKSLELWWENKLTQSVQPEREEKEDNQYGILRKIKA